MSDQSLHDIYSRVLDGYKIVFVVPLIRFDLQKSDYLFLLYSELFNKEPDINIHSTSALGHWKFLLSQIFGNKPVLHYHWLEFQDVKSMLGMIYKMKLLWLYKLFGGKLVWTVHNLHPHDGKWLNVHRILHRWMAKKSDQILVHSKSQINQVSESYDVNSEKIEIIPHPAYPAEIISKKKAVSKLNSKFDLSLDENKIIVGSFGAISAYKNFEQSIKLLDQIGFTGYFLIFGYVKKGQLPLHNRLEEVAKKYDWLIYCPGFVEEEEIPSIMNAIDYCLFNFRDIFTSGSVELARSYKKQIIAPDIGILNDLNTQKNVRLFKTDEELKALLTSLME